MRSYDVMVDVTGQVDLDGPLEVAATVHLPDRLDGPLTVLVGYPGGTYNRRYYDMRRLPGYSQAEHHTNQGFAFVACDYLGVGDSTPVDPFELTFERLAAANHATAVTILERLRAGRLADGLGPIQVEKVVGMGQSMGGGLLTVQQALHRSFDAVAFLGWSGLGTSFANPDGSRLKFPGLPRSADLRAEAAHALDAVHGHVEVLRHTFHADDEDPQLAAADKALSADDPRLPPNAQGDGAKPAPWRAAVLPPCAAMLMAEGAVAREAAAIDVPVLIGSGVIDVVPDPRAEPQAYRGSHDVAVFVGPRMRHMHNFARTRELLWDRIAHFAHGVSRP